MRIASLARLGSVSSNRRLRGLSQPGVIRSGTYLGAGSGHLDRWLA